MSFRTRLSIGNFVLAFNFMQAICIRNLYPILCCTHWSNIMIMIILLEKSFRAGCVLYSGMRSIVVRHCAFEASCIFTFSSELLQQTLLWLPSLHVLLGPVWSNKDVFLGVQTYSYSSFLYVQMFLPDFQSPSTTHNCPFSLIWSLKFYSGHGVLYWISPDALR